MINKQIGPEIIDKLSGRQMISDISKPHTRWYSTKPAKRAQERGFSDTIPPAPFQYIAGTVMFRQIKWGIGIVPDIVSNGIIKPYSLGYGIFISLFDGIHSIVNNFSIIRIHNLRGFKIFFMLRIHL